MENKKRTSVNIPEDAWRRFRSANVAQGKKTSAVLVELIEEYLSRKGKK